MKPTIWRITHLWPNKQPGHGLTAQIEEDQGRYEVYCIACGNTLSLAVPAAEDSTVQIKPETDEPNALPSRFVSLQDYERLERVGHRVLILDDAELGEVSEAHVAVIGELRAALSSEATKGDAE